MRRQTVASCGCSWHQPAIRMIRIADCASDRQPRPPRASRRGPAAGLARAAPGRKRVCCAARFQNSVHTGGQIMASLWHCHVHILFIYELVCEGQTSGGAVAARSAATEESRLAGGPRARSSTCTSVKHARQTCLARDFQRSLGTAFSYFNIPRPRMWGACRQRNDPGYGTICMEKHWRVLQVKRCGNANASKLV